MGTGPPSPPGDGPAPYKRDAQLGDSPFSFPSLSLPTGGFGGGSGISLPTGFGSGSGILPSISLPAGGFGGGSAAPTGLGGLGGGSGSLPSMSMPSGVAMPTGLAGEGRGYQGKISTGGQAPEAETEEPQA